MKKINTIYMLTYLFPPLAHVEETSSIRCGLFEGWVVGEVGDVSWLTGARSCIACLSAVSLMAQWCDFNIVHV